MNVFYSEIILLIISFTDGQKFDILNEHTQCPSTEGEWKKQSDARSCTDQTSYHCLINQYGEFGEVCLNPKPIVVGQCPMYNTATKRIGYTPCMSKEGCAGHTYHSNESYKYKACMRYPTVSSSTENRPTTTIFTTTTTNGSSSSPVVAIAIVLPLILIIGIIIAVWWFYLRKNYNYQIHNPFTGGAIRICHRPEELEEYIDLHERESLVLSDRDHGEYHYTLKRSNPHFVETRMYREIIGQLEKNNVVLVVGNTGIGKSATSIGVLEYYRDRKEWKTIHFPLDPIEKVDERTIVLVDVTFGDFSLYCRYDTNIENMMNRLYTSTRECKEFRVLITSSSSLMHCQTNFPILKGCFELNMSYDIRDLKDLYEKYTKPSMRSPKSDDGSPKSSIDPRQSLDSDIRNEANIVGGDNQTSTEDTCSGNEKDRESSKDNGIDCPPIQERREDGETDPSKEEIEMTDDHEEGNLEENENLLQKAEETWKKSNVSKFGLPIVCYLPGGIEWNASSSEALDVISIFEIYVNNLAESDNGLDRQKYKILVYIMLNGSIVDSKCLQQKLLSEIDQDLNQERFLLHATDLAESGILRRKGNVFSFHNDLLLFAVINSFAPQNIKIFLAYCYLPFSLQFLGPKSTGSRSPRRLKVEVDVHWRTLFEFWSRLFKQQGRSRDELQDFELFQLFREKVEYHEKGTMEFYDIKDKNKTDKKGNVYVRMMVNHYPELKEYYSWTEPEKFKSIKVGFKSTPDKHPPCSLE